MAMTRGQMQRQLRRGGGIMNIAPRKQFGLGSKLKKAVRKIIPNEVSKVATIAAPFVAPFNPALAGAMAGIGSFDQTGSLSGALKSGALTYGGGQLVRGIGGGMQNLQALPGTEGFGGFGGFTKFSSPISSQGGIGKLLEGVKGVGPQGFTGSEVGGDITLAESAGGTSASPKILAEQMSELSLTPTSVSEAVATTAKQTTPSITKLIKEGNYTEAAVEAGKKGLKSIFTTPITDRDGNVVGSKLDKTALLAAGSFGLTYLDAKKIADEAGVDIGTESEYDEATKAEKKEEYASYLTNFFGGRKDGGRIGLKDGTDEKLKEILEMNMTIPKNPNDPRNMTTNEIIFAIQDGRATPEMFEELLLRDTGGISTLMLDEIGGKKFDEPKKVYQFNPSEISQGGAIEDLLFKLRESNPDIYGEYFRPSLEKDRGYRDKPLMAKGGRIGFGDGGEDLSDDASYKGWLRLYETNPDAAEQNENHKKYLSFYNRTKEAQGGRIGYMFGNRVEDREGIMSKLINRPDDAKEKIEELEDIMSMSEDKDMRMAYFPGDVFTKEEISRLFRDRSLTTNRDRKELYKILMNPGMYPEAEDMLIKLLRGNKDGGRIGFESGANKKFKFMELIEDDTDEKEKLINALLENAREKFPEASEEDIFNFVMSKAAPMSSLMVDGKFVKSTDIETPSIKLSRDMGGPRYDFLMGGEVPVRKNKAGIEELDYRQTGGFVPVGVKEKADDVPAMLSKNEFVLTADAVRGIGGGDVEKGAEKLYGVMKQAEKVGRA